MTKKKVRVLTIALCIALLAICVGGTLAYFTAQDKAHNVISSGSIEVDIHEWANEEKTEEFPEDGVDGVMPGSAVTKIVEIENTGLSEAWVRVKLNKAIILAEGVEAEVDLSLVTLDLNTKDWTEKDGWYYYNQPLAPGETTVPLFNKVMFAANMGNEYQKSEATVDVTAQAVQKANNGTSAAEATGWPEE